LSVGTPPGVIEGAIRPTILTGTGSTHWVSAYQ